MLALTAAPPKGATRRRRDAAAVDRRSCSGRRHRTVPVAAEDSHVAAQPSAVIHPACGIPLTCRVHRTPRTERYAGRRKRGRRVHHGATRTGESTRSRIRYHQRSGAVAVAAVADVNPRRECGRRPVGDGRGRKNCVTTPFTSTLQGVTSRNSRRSSGPCCYLS